MHCTPIIHSYTEHVIPCPPLSLVHLPLGSLDAFISIGLLWQCVLSCGLLPPVHSLGSWELWVLPWHYFVMMLRSYILPVDACNPPIPQSGVAQNPRVLFPPCWFWTAFLQQPSASTLTTAVPSSCTFSAFIRGALGMCFLHNFTFTPYILTAQDNAVQYPLAFPQHTKLPQ